MLISFCSWILLQEVILNVPVDALFAPPSLSNRSVFLRNKSPEKVVAKSENTGCHCRESPKVYSVCSGLNKHTLPCTKFPRGIEVTTGAFLLKSTHIKKILHGDFSKLSHLHELRIDGNEYLQHLDAYVFEEMINLTSMSIILNPSLTYLNPRTFNGLVKLKELNLAKNGFHSVKELSKTLTPLVLPELYTLNLNENTFTNISEHDFEAMIGTKLGELKITYCEIQNIHPGAFKYLKELDKLFIGRNPNIDFHTLISLLKETIGHGINIKLLDLHSFGFVGEPPVPLMECISKTNITTLILSMNHFGHLNNKTFPIMMPNLISLDLSELCARTIDSNAFSNFPNLNTLKLNRNKLSWFAASIDLPNLTYLDLRRNVNEFGSEFSLRKSELSKMKLQYLDMEDTRLDVITKADFGHMPHLRILNLKNCSIRLIENNSFQHLSSLAYLKLEVNNFFGIWRVENFEIFGGLENLQALEMGQNQITTLTTSKGYLLKHLEKLEYLYLQQNDLRTISRHDFANLTMLKFLDLSENQIQAWDDRVFLYNNLDRFYGNFNKIAYLSDAMLKDFQNLTEVDLSFNAFTCDCSVKNNVATDVVAIEKFMVLMKGYEVKCLNPLDRTLKQFLRSIVNSTLNCNPGGQNYLVVMFIPFGVLFVLISAASIAGYIYRQHIRYWAFLTRLHLIRKGKGEVKNKENISNDYVFDAFVSYCNQDQDFVATLVKMLEKKAPYLKLCIYERDFQPGSVISESILECIGKSRKTLLLVSNSYAKSYWCIWETQIAEHHRLFAKDLSGNYVDQNIVLIKLGEIKETHLTPTLKYLLKTRIHLQWDLNEDKQKVFWQKLRQFLAPPQNNTVHTSHM